MPYGALPHRGPLVLTEKVDGTNARIIMLRASSVAEQTARAVVAAVGQLRREPLTKPPGIAEAVAQARALAPHLPLEVEVESIDELHAALAAGVRRIMLDDFSDTDMRRAVAITGDQAELEVSGGVSLDRVRAIAQTGVHFISVGALTKHVRALDLSLRLLD